MRLRVSNLMLLPTCSDNLDYDTAFTVIAHDHFHSYDQCDCYHGFPKPQPEIQNPKLQTLDPKA